MIILKAKRKKVPNANWESERHKIIPHRLYHGRKKNQMKKCECLDCGYFNDSKDNHCNTYNDLTFTGCTCDSNCEGFKTKEEAYLLERLFYFRNNPGCTRSLARTEKQLEALRSKRERRKNAE